MEFFCVKHKAKVEIPDDQVKVEVKKGRKFYTATCPVCGTKVYRIGGRA